MKMPEAYASFKEWALYYASTGLSVFPLLPNDKKPVTKNGVKDATTDIRQISQWWDRKPDCNIGIACGSISGGLVVIDLDRHEDRGVDGYHALKEWEQLNGKLPDTATCITGSGGYHYYYLDPLHEYSNTAGKQAAGIDTRGSGGYVVAPPSIHPNGNRYEWEANQDDFLITAADFTVRNFLSYDQKRGSRQSYELPEEIPEGSRTDALFKLVSSLTSKGLSDEAIKAAVRAENETKCSPPLSDRELEQEVFPAISRYEKGTAPYQGKGHDHIQPQETDENGFCEYTGEMGKRIEFPVHCLPDVLKDFVLAVAESVQVSPGMVAIPVLAAVATAVQGKYWVQVKRDYKEPLNIYGLIVGRPSERKSPVINHVCKPIREYADHFNKAFALDIMQYKTEHKILRNKIDHMSASMAKAAKNGKNSFTLDDIMEQQRKLKELEENKVTEMRILFDDVTPESLVGVLNRNEECASIISAEGGIFGTLAGRYSKEPNMDIFLKAYSGESYSCDRVGRDSETLKKPLLTMLLAVQPSVVESVMNNKDFRGRGLTARFLYCFPESLVGNRPDDGEPVPEEIEKEYASCITELLKIGKDDRMLQLSEAAAEARRAYSSRIEEMLNNELYDVEEWAGKLVGNTVRIAGLLHCASFRGASYTFPISGETMSRAIEIGWYLLNQAQMVHNVCDAQNGKDALLILGKICEGYQAGSFQHSISKRDALRKCRSKKLTEEWGTAIKKLVENGYIKTEKRKNTRARPSEYYVVNPKYLKDMEENRGIKNSI